MNSIERLQDLASIRRDVPVSAIWDEFWFKTLLEAEFLGGQARHTALIRLACELGGWQARGWKKGIRRELLGRPPKGCRSWRRDAAEILEEIESMPCVPDAWRVRREGRREGWGHGVFVIELLEVEVTHCISSPKESRYMSLWWETDATEHFDTRIWRMNRNGFVSPLVGGFDEAHRIALAKDISRWSKGFSLDFSAAA